MKFAYTFFAGILSLLIFHQGLLHLLYIAGVSPLDAYDFRPTVPLQVPAVVSMAFFGGVWAILLGVVIESVSASHFWFKSFLFGAFAPTSLSIALVAPLKNLPVTKEGIFLDLFLNGVWGLGVALFIYVKKKYPVLQKTTHDKNYFFTSSEKSST